MTTASPGPARPGTLYLVRHGQASFGTDDYDRLSDLGHRQARRLGAYFQERSLRFDAVFTGTLRRQRETLEGIAAALPGLPVAREHTGLNEYDSHAVVHAVHPEPLPRPDTPELYRHHFRILRGGLMAWMEGRAQPAGMPSFADFRDGVRAALAQALPHKGGRVLMVSSGGPISTALGLVLGLAPEAIIQLNYQIRNSSVTELSFGAQRHSLLTYNTLPHLDQAEFTHWVTST